MSLKNLMSLSAHRGQKFGLSEERLSAQLRHLRHLISFYREYPDLLVDFMKGPDSTFRFYFYQRVFLRIVMRHRYVYATFPRACENAPISENFGQTSLIKGTLNLYII